MRKIENQSEKEKRETRNKIIIGVILVVIMVLSTAGFAFFGEKKQTNAEKISYNGLDFSITESGMWQTQIQNYVFTTTYNPLDTENITIAFLISLQEYSNKPLFFVSDNRIAVAEISQNLAPFVGRAQYACLENNCTENLPVKNCTDNIIIIKYSNVSKLSKEDNCVFIESDNEIMAVDALLFKILGIKKF